MGGAAAWAARGTKIDFLIVSGCNGDLEENFLRAGFK
jgi:hypothetical protein